LNNYSYCNLYFVEAKATWGSLCIERVAPLPVCTEHWTVKVLVREIRQSLHVSVAKDETPRLRKQTCWHIMNGGRMRRRVGRQGSGIESSFSLGEADSLARMIGSHQVYEIHGTPALSIDSCTKNGPANWRYLEDHCSVLHILVASHCWDEKQLQCAELVSGGTGTRTLSKCMKRVRDANSTVDYPLVLEKNSRNVFLTVRF
jgi:hypothetical protein